MNLSQLEDVIWHHAPGLCGTGEQPVSAMAAVLAAAEDYAAAVAADTAEELAAVRTARILAGCYAPDPAEVTERRRAVLEAALSGVPGDAGSEAA